MYGPVHKSISAFSNPGVKSVLLHAGRAPHDMGGVGERVGAGVAGTHLSAFAKSEVVIVMPTVSGVHALHAPVPFTQATQLSSSPVPVQQTLPLHLPPTPHSKWRSHLVPITEGVGAGVGAGTTQPMAHPLTAVKLALV